MARGATDSAEKVRESCFALVAQYVARCAGALGPVLKTLVPALTRAMGAGSEEEPSEEIRLARATLVGEICARSKDSDVLASFADEMADVIASATRDPFHDVKKATHRAVEAFVEGLTEGNDTGTTGNKSGNESGEVNANASTALKKHARALCAAVLPDARHRHSQTRLSCLRAVSSLVPFLSVADMEELVAPGLQPMCADRTPGVRLALHEALARWMVADRTSDVEKKNASKKSATLRDASRRSATLRDASRRFATIWIIPVHESAPQAHGASMARRRTPRPSRHLATIWIILVHESAPQAHGASLLPTLMALLLASTRG